MPEWFDLATAQKCERQHHAVPPESGFPGGDRGLFRQLWDYWLLKRGGRLAPSRADIDPADIVRLLPGILLIEVTDGPRFRHRLASTAVAAIHGQELTGLYVDELEPASFRELLDSDLRLMLKNRAPQFVSLRFVNRQGRSRSYDVLRLPLSDDGKTVTKILIFSDFGFRNRQ